MNQATRYKVTAGILFLLPSIVFLAMFFLYPALMSFRYSVTDWNGIRREISFVGFDMFRRVASSRQFRQVLWNTIYLAIIYVPVLNMVAMTLALAVNSCGKKSGNIFKTILFFPNVLALAVVGYVWKMLYDTNMGAINRFLRGIGLDMLAKDWLGLNATVLPSVSFTIIWQAAGYYMVIYLAGLIAIPKELYEAADIDGASAWRVFKGITFPMLAPSLTINLVLSTIGILSCFDLPYTMTKGGPGYASTTLALQIYFYNYRNIQPAQGMAMSVIMCLINVTISLVLLSILKRRELK
jgi:multiple sugar transport system permease protein/raffinose/stachyose/melibiose transport system permease protein